MNELEAFTSIITSAVPDELTLYRAVGKNFVSKLENNHLDHFVIYMSLKENLYTNIAEIYNLWATRQTIEDLEKLENINTTNTKKIESMRSRVDKIKRESIVPIGTDD